MCFSAGASFGAGILLSVTGAAAFSQAKSNSHKIIAAIPLIFSVQQFIEGILWLSISGKTGPQYESAATHLFLFFAQVVWPVWIPLTMMLFEKNQIRKRILKFLLGSGAVLSACLLFGLFIFPVSAVESSNHIQYSLHFPSKLIFYGNTVYIIATLLPPFVSSSRKMNLLGLMLLGSFLISKIFFNDQLTSVWCYFAAIISLYLIWVLYTERKQAVAILLK